EFILSHHIGDLDDISAMKAFEEGVSHFSRLFRLEPGVVAYDLHPDYMSTRFALASGYVTKTGVQHHKAHIASCMAENNLKGEVIGIAFDGTGYGEDGNLWGGEFFTGSPAGMARRAHLRYVRLPGGEAAIREPWRMAASYMKDAGVGVDGDDSRFCCSKEEFAVISSMTGAGFNSPYTSSLGRLFDAVSSMTGICRISAFEGQAAMKLEYFSEGRDSGSYKFEINMEAGAYVIDTREIIRGVAADIQRGIDRSTISDKFHETVAVLVEETSLLLRKETGLKRVVLSGGVFQNMRLLGKCLEKLEKSRFEVYIHRLVPANDGGLSLGQAVIAIEQLKC
ncbi:MAG: carbamoyltransferase HypF, partial [Clostridiales bacterium]|nr:carbamoyltransferase HypF [Clostridiales bacterium]